MYLHRLCIPEVGAEVIVDPQDLDSSIFVFSRMGAAWLVADGWWLVAGGWWLVAGGCKRDVLRSLQRLHTHWAETGEFTSDTHTRRDMSC